MLTDDKRPAMLAQTGSVLAVALCEATGDGWMFIPGVTPGFGVLPRKDGMQLGLAPMWLDGAIRLEVANHLQADGRAPAPAGHGQAPCPALRIQCAVTQGIEAGATDVAYRLVEPYDAHTHRLRPRPAASLSEGDAQRQVADLLTWLTGGAQAWRGGATSACTRTWAGGACPCAWRKAA